MEALKQYGYTYKTVWLYIYNSMGIHTKKYGRTYKTVWLYILKSMAIHIK